MPLHPKSLLLLALAFFALFYLFVFVRAHLAARRRPADSARPVSASPAALGTGFVTNFFDTLGIGSFAPTTAMFRHFRMVRDEIIPGTLNVGHTLPAIAQAFIFTTVVPVETMTLIALISAAIMGAWLGAGVVAGWPRRRIQIGMGAALLVAAVILVYRTAIGDPIGSDALGLTGARLWIGVGGNFILGSLMTLGIGLYAPCMILVSMLGMNPITAFPIMMGSCAFLMPVASTRFVRARAYSPGVSLGLLAGGIPAVLIAAFLVKSFPLTVIKYLVVLVVLYTSAGLLRSAYRERMNTAVGGDGTKGTAVP